MLTGRRGPSLSRWIVIGCLLICSILIAGLIGWNLSSSPSLKPIDPQRDGQSQKLDFNASFDFSNIGTQTPGAAGKGQSLLPTQSARPRPTNPTPTPISASSAAPYKQAVDTPDTGSDQKFSGSLLSGVMSTPTPAVSQPVGNYKTQQLGPTTSYNNSLSASDLSGPAIGKVTARGAELVDAQGARYFVAGVNYEGHTDRA